MEAIPVEVGLYTHLSNMPVKSNLDSVRENETMFIIYLSD